MVVEGAKEYLKGDDSPGIDNVPSKSIKSCTSSILRYCTCVELYNRAARFSKTMDQSSTLFKCNFRLDIYKYRRIKIQLIIEKIFEI